VGQWFFRDYEEKKKRHHEIKEFAKNNPHIPQHELYKSFFKEGPLSPEESAKVHEDIALSGQLLMYLLKHRHLLSDEPIQAISTQQLFDNIDVTEEFGIANCISNSLYHLEEILKNLTLTQLYENMYEAKSSVKNTKGEAISVTYTFQANTTEVPREKFFNARQSVS
jgi:hypothetical protein